MASPTKLREDANDDLLALGLVPTSSSSNSNLFVRLSAHVAQELRRRTLNHQAVVPEDAPPDTYWSLSSKENDISFLPLYVQLKGNDGSVTEFYASFNGGIVEDSSDTIVSGSGRFCY